MRVDTITSRARVEKADIAERYLDALIAAREETEEIVGQEVDLCLDNERVRNYIHRLLRHDTLFNGQAPLVLLDLHQVSASESPLRGVVVLDEKGATFERYSLDKLRCYIKGFFKTGKIGVTSVDILAPGAARDQDYEAGKPIYYAPWTDNGVLSQVLPRVEQLPQGVVQRLAVISAPEAYLPEEKLQFYANFLSELAGVASRLKWSAAFEAYSIGHLLKHRLGGLQAAFTWIRQGYEDSDSDLPTRMHNYQSCVEHVYYLAEMVHLLHFAWRQGAATTLGVKGQAGFRFSTEDVLDDLTKMIRTVAPQCAYRHKEEICLELPPSLKAMIKPFFHIGSDRTVRLQDELYYEIWFEVLINTLHGISQNGLVSVTVEWASVEGLDAIVISNAASNDILQEKLGEPLSDWRAWSDSTPTGLRLVSDLLRLTQAGELFYRHPLQAGESQRCFSVALAFRGLALSSAAGSGGEAYGQDSDSLT